MHRVMAINNLLDLKVATTTMWTRPVLPAPAVVNLLPASLPYVCPSHGAVFKFGSNVVTRAPVAVNKPAHKSQEAANRLRAKDLMDDELDVGVSVPDMIRRGISTVEEKNRRGDTTSARASTDYSSITSASEVTYTHKSGDSDVDDDYEFLPDDLPTPFENYERVVRWIQTTIQSPIVVERKKTVYTTASRGFKDHFVHRGKPVLATTVLSVLFDDEGMPTLVANHQI